mmetsp:Transcript_95985/g.222498  ORF Transcript_95985/g.222498 Transcript_95985/m.222498 type:complete len:248 (+) Transcript_95985:20-763(+)
MRMWLGPQSLEARTTEARVMPRSCRCCALGWLVRSLRTCDGGSSSTSMSSRCNSSVNCQVAFRSPRDLAAASLLAKTKRAAPPNRTRRTMDPELTCAKPNAAGSISDESGPSLTFRGGVHHRGPLSLSSCAVSSRSFDLKTGLGTRCLPCATVCARSSASAHSPCVRLLRALAFRCSCVTWCVRGVALPLTWTSHRRSSLEVQVSGSAPVANVSTTKTPCKPDSSVSWRVLYKHGNPRRSLARNAGV